MRWVAPPAVMRLRRLQCLSDYLEKKAIGDRQARNRQKEEPSVYKKVLFVEAMIAARTPAHAA